MMIHIGIDLHNEVRGGYNSYRADASVITKDNDTIVVRGEWVAHSKPSLAIQGAVSEAIRELCGKVDIK